MDFIKKFFSSKPKAYDQIIPEEDKPNQRQMTLDEQFVYHFIKKGGKFFYPDDMDDFKVELLKLLKYLNIEKFAVIERSYLHFLNKLGVPVTDEFRNAPVLLGGCESLIANEGAIMTTAEHTKSFRNQELPAKRVVVALSTQIVTDKQQALTQINNKYPKPPANIQTMSIFAPPKDTLLGGNWYETYLFLIEN